MNYNPSLDGFRALAVTGVLVAHFFPWVYFPILKLPFGRMGVVAFFVLSGFLITSILMNYASAISVGEMTMKQAWWKFIVRRTLRIFPLYFGVILFFSFVLDYERMREQLVWHLTYTSNIGQALWGINFGAANHFWSLCVDEQFYLFWPFFVLGLSGIHYRRFYLTAIAVSFIAAMIWAAVDMPGRMAGYFPIGGSSFALTMGSYFAWIVKSSNGKRPNLSQTCKYAALAVLLLVLIIGDFIAGALELFLLDCSWSVVCAYAIYHLHFNGNRLLSSSPFVFIGKISYGIYVYHMVLSILDYKFFGILGIDQNTDLWSAFVAKTSLTILISVASYYLYERHFLKLKEKIAP